MGVPEILRYAKRDTEQMENTPVNIAVIGQARMGKSTFINALRGLGPDDKDAAKEGITQTTFNVTPYPHPDHPNFIIWDLPGTGTKEFPIETYFDQIQFSTYDFYFVLIKDIPFENDIKLVQAMSAAQKMFFLVRTYIDHSLASEKRKKLYNEHTTLAQIRQACLTPLETENIFPLKTFLVSNYHPLLWEFPLIIDELINTIPVIKRNAFVNMLSVKSNRLIQYKSDRLYIEIYYAALASAVAAATPLPGLGIAADIAILGTMVDRIKTQFGVDERSIKQFEERYRIKRGQLAIDSGTVTAGMMFRAGSKYVTNRVAENVVKEASKYIPIIGSAVAASIAFPTTYSALSLFLEDAKADAFLVYKREIEIQRRL